jgi:hypothetical protein
MHKDVLRLNICACYPWRIALNVGLGLSFYKIEDVAYRPWWWRRYILPLGSAVSELHGVTTQKIMLFKVIVMGTLYPTRKLTVDSVKAILLLDLFFNLKMEAIFSSETSVDSQRTTRGYIPVVLQFCCRCVTSEADRVKPWKTKYKPKNFKTRINVAVDFRTYAWSVKWDSLTLRYFTCGCRLIPVITVEVTCRVHFHMLIQCPILKPHSTNGTVSCHTRASALSACLVHSIRSFEAVQLSRMHLHSRAR